MKALSFGRGIVADLMRLARRTPAVAAERRFDMSALIAARAACAERPAWTSIFAKAYALTAQEIPPLRQVPVRWPLARLYEYPVSAGMIAVERTLDGEPVVLGCLVKDPAALPVAEISRRIRHAASAPPHEVREFRAILRAAKYPAAIRQLLWSMCFAIPRQRANYFGTFGLSTIAAFGADLIQPLSAWTTLVTYSRFDVHGGCAVRLVFDHRVLDGATAARVLVRLEQMLNGPVLVELRALSGTHAATDCGSSSLPPRSGGKGG